jgi:hypothetical protein
MKRSVPMTIVARGLLAEPQLRPEALQPADTFTKWRRTSRCPRGLALKKERDIFGGPSFKQVHAPAQGEAGPWREAPSLS